MYFTGSGMIKYLFVFYIFKKLLLMKRIVIILAVCAVMAVVVASCQGSKKCPAYSQNNTEQASPSRF
jgi:hypothetical protein